MEATTLGINRTGTATAPERTQAMLDATNQLTTPQPIDTSASEAQHIVYISESEALGSIPPPPSVKGVIKSGVAKLKGSNPSIFMDKIGERIAFERGGVRLYDALITKYQALSQTDSDLLSGQSAAGTSTVAPLTESPAETLARIRSEELAHFKMLCQAMEQLGGDPTAQTPCADVIGTASMGLIQVVTDPRTTLAQSLSAILTAELTDNAGWELLIELAEDAGEDDLAGRFVAALSEEQAHLTTVQNWLRTLVLQGAGTPAL
ncbi:MAG: ferritin-like domain-containing protein [Pseudomonadota bacterium]|nr:ferritin-like domain-containing protein [Pseudomonadota bacterium]